jgi:hypothetical protein
MTKKEQVEAALDAIRAAMWRHSWFEVLNGAIDLQIRCDILTKEEITHLRSKVSRHQAEEWKKIRAAVEKLADELSKEMPRRYEDWEEDKGACLWWNTEPTGGAIEDTPDFVGDPRDSLWPYESEDEKHLLWVPLPRLASIRAADKEKGK